MHEHAKENAERISENKKVEIMSENEKCDRCLKHMTG